jgi:PAS domain S-box-containing protein
MSVTPPIRPEWRPSPPAAAALFALAGVVLLLIPQLAGRMAAGEAQDFADALGDLLFLVVGAAAVWYLASRIETAFRAETAARSTVERRERLLDEVIDVVPAAVLLLADADEPAVARANPAARRLLDLEDAGSMPRRLQEVMPIDLATTDALSAALTSRSSWTGERTITTHSGRRLPLALFLTPVTPGTGTRAVLVVADRTEVRFAERESERLAVELEGLVETSPVGFVTVGPDGTVAAWNAAAERILGWPAAAMVGAHLPADLGAIIAASLAAGAGLGGGSHPGATAASIPETRLHRADGTPVFVRLTATTAYGRGHEFFGFTAMFEDVTEARRIESERDDAEARLRAAVDASPMPLVLLDTDGKVRLWSAAAEEMFGWTADEAMGRLFPPVPDEGLPRFFDRLAKVLDGAMLSGELARYVGRDGRPVTSRVWSAPVRASDGTLVGVMEAFREEPIDMAPSG